MSAISGGLRKLSIKRATDVSFLDVGHLVSDSWNTQADIIETTTRDNNGYKSFIPNGLESTIDATCILFQDADLSGKIGFKDLLEVLQNQEQVEYRLEIVGEAYSYFGVMHIRSIGDTASVSDLISFDISFQLSGKPVQLGDNTAPSAPILTLTNNNQQQLILDWTQATDDIGVVGYELRKFRVNQPTQNILVGNVLTYEDNAVSQGLFYAYNVRAIDAAGNVSEWSNKVASTVFLPADPGLQTTTLLFQDGEEKQTQDGTLIIKQ